MFFSGWFWHRFFSKSFVNHCHSHFWDRVTYMLSVKWQEENKKEACFLPQAIPCKNNLFNVWPLELRQYYFYYEALSPSQRPYLNGLLVSFLGFLKKSLQIQNQPLFCLCHYKSLTSSMIKIACSILIKPNK